MRIMIFINLAYTYIEIIKKLYLIGKVTCNYLINNLIKSNA